MSEPISVRRDLPAVRIPSGDKITIPAGARVSLAQSLGGSFTVWTEYGDMVRIDGKDADAIGLTPTAAPAASTAAEGSLEDRIWAELKTIYDPEIPVNVADLGLIYEMKLTAVEGGSRVEIKMSMTAPGCGMGDVLKADAEAKLSALPGVKQVAVELVFEPPWDPSRMSEAARLQLNMF